MGRKQGVYFKGLFPRGTRFIFSRFAKKLDFNARFAQERRANGVHAWEWHLSPDGFDRAKPSKTEKFSQRMISPGGTGLGSQNRSLPEIKYLLQPLRWRKAERGRERGHSARDAPDFFALREKSWGAGQARFSNL